MPLPQRAASLHRLAPQLLGLPVLALGFALELRTLNHPISLFDEGLILSGARGIVEGEVPYRDFYSNYPPGIFLAVALLLKLGGHLIAFRFFGLVLHCAIALLAGAMAARIGGRRFSVLAAGVVLLWLQHIGVAPFAWIFGLMLAMAALFALSLAADHPERRGLAVAAGLLLGATGCVRHDLLAYLTVAFVAQAVAWRVLSGEWQVPRRVLFTAAAAAAIPLLLCWGWVIAYAGLKAVANDVFFYQVRYVMPSRVLPLPDFTRLDARFGVSLPVFLVAPYETALALVLLGPLLAVLALTGARERPGRRQAALLGALSLAVIPQATGRADLYHAVYAVTPALVLLCASAERLWSVARRALRPLAIPVLGVLLLAPSKSLPHVPDWLRDGAPMTRLFRTPRQDPAYAGREELIEWVKTNTPADTRIFVGTFSHRRVFVSDADLPFLTERLPATRYLHLDPGLVARPEVQQEMIDQLERRPTALAVLVKREPIDEPNTSANEGAGRLDEYLAQNYETVWERAAFRVARRHGSSAR